MRSRSRPVGLIVSGGLVLLIALLATLQYRWLGQVSKADLDQRRKVLHQGAEDFAADFDREITRTYLQLSADADSLSRRDWSSFAARYEIWRDGAKDPRMVKGVYLAGDDGTTQTFSAYRPETRVFEPAAWPDALAPIRASLAGARSTPPTAPPGAPRIANGFVGGVSATDPGLSRMRLVTHEPIVASVPALVISLTSAQTFSFVDMTSLFSMRVGTQTIIVWLDRDYLQSTLLPAMVTRHFPSNDQYRFAILDGADTAHPVYARGLAAGGTLDPAHADESMPMFALRSDLVAQNLVVRATGTADAQFTLENRTMKAVPHGTPAPPPAPESMPAPSTSARGANGVMSIIVDARGTTGSNIFYAPRGTSPITWQLVLQHTAGSLDAAVDHARVRNLWLSFGILAVLAAGVGLVVVNAERSRKLAVQQMDFVATVSHELRTPLTVIRSAAQNLSAGVVSDPAQAKRYGDLIESEGRRLTDMVEQVLEYAGLSGNRHLARAHLVDAGGLVRDIADAAAPLFEAERCEVDVAVADALPPILADEGAIRRAVNNLIANALKYGADGRWIRVAATASGAGTAGRAGEVLIAVSDRGRGIDPEDLPHIFEAFYRGRYAVDRQIHGNGLGLSLVKRIAEAHGGRVTVASTRGEGATFTIHLPAATPDTSAVTPLTEPSTESGGQPA